MEGHILGSEKFVEWLKKNILKKKHDREYPTLWKLQKYKAREIIIDAIEQETGKSEASIKEERWIARQINEYCKYLNARLAPFFLSMNLSVNSMLNHDQALGLDLNLTFEVVSCSLVSQ